mmetsp:Transcript_144466/g.277072  ORF Transcript_144466/g.277072 Transcript_144466/m.277072 type:complete len:85 (+) Transcript_144466:440-694(+)
MPTQRSQPPLCPQPGDCRVQTAGLPGDAALLSAAVRRAHAPREDRGGSYSPGGASVRREVVDSIHTHKCLAGVHAMSHSSTLAP